MLPCQKTCPHYCEGCHKTCTAWRTLQQRQQEDRQRKKEYLRRANEAGRRLYGPPDGPLKLCPPDGGLHGEMRSAAFFLPVVCSAVPDVV